MNTLYNINKFLFGFFTGHKQVNLVTVDNDLDFSALRDAVYPYVNIEPVNSSANGNIITQNYLITISDIMSESFKGENNYRLIDGCQRIANDFITFMQGVDDLDIAGTVTFNNFEEGTDDRTAGVIVSLGINYFRYVDYCSLIDLLKTNEPLLDVIYYGASNNPIDPIQADPATLGKSLSIHTGGAITIPFEYVTEPSTYYVVEPITQPKKTRWATSPTNQSIIGKDKADNELFYVVEANGYRWYITSYVTLFPTEDLTLS